MAEIFFNCMAQYFGHFVPWAAGFLLYDMIIGYACQEDDVTFYADDENPGRILVNARLEHVQRNMFFCAKLEPGAGFLPAIYAIFVLIFVLVQTFVLWCKVKDQKFRTLGYIIAMENAKTGMSAFRILNIIQYVLVAALALGAFVIGFIELEAKEQPARDYAHMMLNIFVFAFMGTLGMEEGIWYTSIVGTPVHAEFADNCENLKNLYLNFPWHKSSRSVIQYIREILSNDPRLIEKLLIEATYRGRTTEPSTEPAEAGANMRTQSAKEREAALEELCRLGTLWVNLEANKTISGRVVPTKDRKCTNGRKTEERKEAERLGTWRRKEALHVGRPDLEELFWDDDLQRDERTKADDVMGHGFIPGLHRGHLLGGGIQHVSVKLLASIGAEGDPDVNDLYSASELPLNEKARLYHKDFSVEKEPNVRHYRHSEDQVIGAPLEDDNHALARSAQHRLRELYWFFCDPIVRTIVKGKVLSGTPQGDINEDRLHTDLRKRRMKVQLVAQQKHHDQVESEKNLLKKFRKSDATHVSTGLVWKKKLAD